MPDEDDLADKYLLTDERLAAAGYEWYEVSNWARDEAARCRHNLGYWRGADWWGAGPGAHSHVGGVRWWNVKHPAAYADRLGRRRQPGARPRGAGRRRPAGSSGCCSSSGCATASTSGCSTPRGREAVPGVSTAGCAGRRGSAGADPARARLLADGVCGTAQLTIRIVSG